LLGVFVRLDGVIAASERFDLEGAARTRQLRDGGDVAQ